MSAKNGTGDGQAPVATELLEALGSLAGFRAAQNTSWDPAVGGYAQASEPAVVHQIPRAALAAMGAKLRARIAQLRDIHATYLAYLKKRIEEHDWHGGWDACVNLSETEMEISGLEFALKAIEGP